MNLCGNRRAFTRALVRYYKFDKNNRRDKNKNRHQNKDFNQEQEVNQNQPIEQEVQVEELTKTKVNELIDDLIKDVVIESPQEEKAVEITEIKEEKGLTTHQSIKFGL